jgi:kinesin family protein 13
VNTDYRNQNNQHQYSGTPLAPQYPGQNSQPVLGSQQQPSGILAQNPILQEPINNAEIVKAIPQLEEHLVQQTPTNKFANKNNNNVYYNQQNQHFDSSNARPTSLPLQSNAQHGPNSYLPHEQHHRYSTHLSQHQPIYSTTFAPEPSRQPVYSTPHNNYAVTSTTKPSTKLYHQPSTTEQPRSDDSDEDQKEVDVTKKEENKKKSQANLAALPDEVPADLREQLLSSGILGNADIQVLDYDKVGDIPIESLPPEALENFYGAGSAPVPSVVKPGDPGLKPVEMKVVRYDPNTKEGQDVADTYVREDATRLDPVVLNDSRYNRYLPLKVSGTQFPLPDVPQLKGRIVNSVVVLAPVDYDFIKQPDEGDDRAGKAIQVQGVRFIAGESLKNLVKNPTQENYRKWLEQEKATPSERQSVVLLVTRSVKTFMK